MTEQPESLRSASALDSIELGDLILDRYRKKGIEFVVPEVATNDDLLASFHYRIQHVQDYQPYWPETIEAQYLEGVHAGKSLDFNHNDTLDRAINRSGAPAISINRLNDYGMSRLQQILLFRGIVIATNARRHEAETNDAREFSPRQQAIQRAAMYSIKHFASNPVHVCQDDSEKAIEKFTTMYSASYIAQLIRREVFAENPPEVYDERSVVRAMGILIPFGALLSRHYDTTQSVFTLGGSSEKQRDEAAHFEPVHITDVDHTRITDLMALKGILGDRFTQYNFFDTVRPFVSGRNRSGQSAENSSEKNQTERTQDRLDDRTQESYVVLEIAGYDKEGNDTAHIIAENAQVDNACYGLRQEILDEWQRIIGVRFRWQDVMIQKKEVVRQMGAKKFHHNVGSNVPERIRQYLTQDAETVVLTAFGRLFDSRHKEFFDDQMMPTTHNKLPPFLIRQIQGSPLLQTFWPLIREYGYAQTFRLMGSMYRAELQKPSEVVESRPVVESPQNKPTKLADELWNRVIADEMRRLYEK